MIQLLLTGVTKEQNKCNGLFADKTTRKKAKENTKHELAAGLTTNQH
jgi:hypothetical protein